MSRTAVLPRARRRWALLAALATALALVPLAAVSAAQPARAAPAAAPAFSATVTVNTAGKLTGGISSHFIGLSFESSTLSNGYRYDAVGNLPQMLKNLGSSVMRFGGNTADTTFTGSTQAELDALSRLTKASGWSVIYTENLGHYNAAQVKADAQRVSATLGSGLDAFACGNEPDQYGANGIRSASYTTSDYLTQAGQCYGAIRSAVKNAPLEGPDTAWNPAWLSAFRAKFGNTVKLLGQHYYPLGCANPDISATAAAPELLSSALSTKEATTLETYLSDAAGSKAPLRITEANSACDGGVKGLSNAYGSALWVIDYLLIAAEHGVNGINFHGGLNTLCSGYTPLCQVGVNTYAPQPIYYGMLLTRYFGEGAFLPASVTMSDSTQHVAAFADKATTGGTERVMVDNMGAGTASTKLQITGYQGTSAQVLRLTGGSSPLDTSGIRIQGAQVQANGTLTPGAATAVACKSGTCSLTLAPYSAAVVTLN